MPRLPQISGRELIRLLESLGYEVVTRTSPFEFNRTLGREKPDLALIDVAMPALRGDKLVDNEWMAKIRTWQYRPYSINGRPVPFCPVERSQAPTGPETVERGRQVAPRA